MSKIKNILLTGDDGYNAPGLRLIIAALRDKYQLHVSATSTQQSGVGGMITIKNGFEWGEAEVDGIKALWSKGTPCDSMELAYAYFEKPFDLIVSGLNWGANLSSAIGGSGTVNAALRGMSLKLAPRAMALSWDLPLEAHKASHSGGEEINDYWDYPGRQVDQVLDLAFENDFWQAKFLNINFPQQPSDQAMIASTSEHVIDVYDHSQNRIINQSHGKFEYLGQRINPQMVKTPQTDLEAVAAGLIAITPCKIDYIDSESYARYKDKQYNL